MITFTPTDTMTAVSGSVWFKKTYSAAFGNNSAPEAIEFNGNMYLIIGGFNGGSSLDDVFVSSDG